MVEEDDQQPEEKLRLDLPGLFGGRKRKKSHGTPADEEPGDAPRQPFDDDAAPEEYDDEPAAAPAPASRFTPPTAPDEPAEPGVETTRPLPRAERVSTGSTTEDGSKARKPRKPLPPLLVAPVVGLFVGVLACGLTYAGMIGCQEIRGTTACGGPGFFVLMAIIAILVAVGSFLLKTFGVPDPTSTSLLAVGIVAVLALAFLIGVIFAWWMILVIPVLSAAAFAGSAWLTHLFATTEVD